MEIQDTSVEVLYDFEYATKDGQRVSIKEGERLLLLKKTNDDWWQVIRSNGRRPFYVPSTYVKENEKKRDFTVTVSIKRTPPQTATRVFLNRSESDDGGSGDEREEKSGGTVVILSGEDSGYSTVQLSSRGLGEKVTAEANILEEPLSGSLAELAGQIRFAPGSGGFKARSESSVRDLHRSSSFKKSTEGRRTLFRRLSESCPDVKSISQSLLETHPEERAVSDKNDSTDSVDSEKVSTVGSSSDSVDKPVYKPTLISVTKPTVPLVKPLPKPRKLHKKPPSLDVAVPPGLKDDEVIYANCVELAKQRLMGKESVGEGVDGVGVRAAAPPLTSSFSSSSSLVKPPKPLPRGWSTQLDQETNQPCYVHNISGDKWFSSSDGEGRVYYYQEHSAESSWTLPDEPSNNEGKVSSGSPVPSSPTSSIAPTTPTSPNPSLLLSTTSLPPLDTTSTSNNNTSTSNTNQVGHELEVSKSAVDLASVLARISGIPDHSRRIRSVKTLSMIEQHSYKKDEELLLLSSQKNWPQLSEGKMYVLCEGPLHYTKISESGKRVRKNWTAVYVVLTELFLLVYKDIKAFHSLKTHPELTVDLNGADVSSGQKVSGRKHVLVVSTLLGLQVALQGETLNSALHWATQINTAIANLPKATEVASQGNKLSSINESTEEIRKGTSIGRSKSVNFKNKDGSMEDLASSAERQMKIKARLKKFFHKRPTMESLVKKGIWKDEPVFGCYLEQACGSNVPRVPPFVVKCITCIEKGQENMKTDGLYRASGNLSQIQKIRLQIDQNNYSVLDKEEDVHVLTGALKLFFRELKEPLIPYKLFPKAIKACMTSNKKEKTSMFLDIIKALPTSNRDTLKFLLQHLLRVTQFQEYNRMHIANVAIVFGPTLMWPEQESLNMALDLLQQNMVIENLLSDYSLFFKDK